VVNCDAARRKLVQQLAQCGRHLSITLYDHGPFQVLPECSGDDVPPIERRRPGSSNLNERPMANESERNIRVRGRTAHDEMIVAIHVTAVWGVARSSFYAARQREQHPRQPAEMRSEGSLRSRAAGGDSQTSHRARVCRRRLSQDLGSSALCGSAHVQRTCSAANARKPVTFAGPRG